MKYKNILVLSSLFCCISLSAKVLIFTYSYNRPDFIEIQHKTFSKFLLDDYEFVVLNDAIDEKPRTEIEQICQKYNIRCIRMPQELHDPIYNPSLRNCSVVNFSLKALGFAHDDIVALIDSDMFLIKQFSIRDYLKNYELAGLSQIKGNIEYLWIGIVFLNMATMPNKDTISFSCGRVGDFNTDSGGFTHYYLKNNPDARVKFTNAMYLEDFCCDSCRKSSLLTCPHLIYKMKKYGFSDPLIKLAQNGRDTIMELHVDGCFLHYRAGTNWNFASAEYHQRKTNLVNTFMAELLAS